MVSYSLLLIKITAAELRAGYGNSAVRAITYKDRALYRSDVECRVLASVNHYLQMQEISLPEQLCLEGTPCNQ